jgi:lipoprotein-anchoring transpeptidase ErfK/SrfK
MAIHGTSDPSSIGAASSAGCIRAAHSDLELLMSRVPVGTPVVIRR